MPVTLPNAIFGTYYLFVVADRYEQVYEHFFEGNNTRRSDPLQIVLSPPPDFQVTSITAPPLAQSGAVARISYTVTNMGAGALIFSAAGFASLDSSSSFDMPLITKPPEARAIRTYREIRISAVPGVYTQSIGSTPLAW